MKDGRKPWVCPICHTEVTDFPALSRRDNKTEICSDCGTRDALDDFFGFGSSLKPSKKLDPEKEDENEETSQEVN